MCSQEPNQTSVPSLKNYRVAVVDDDLDVLSSLRFLLETEGFKVCTFRTPSSLLHLDASPQIDCYVLDYRMEPISGIDLASKIHERDADAAIVLITGHPDASIQVEARRAGIYSVLLKPHLQEVLTQAIFAATAVKRHLRSN